MVGMPDTFFSSAVNTSSYTVCAMVKIEPTAGKVVNMSCRPSTQQFRYVIIQSLDTSPERLCIAEVAVYCTSQCAIVTFILMHHCLSESNWHSNDKHVFLFLNKTVVVDKFVFSCYIDKLTTATYITW